MVRHWNRLAGEMVDVVSLEAFKVSLDQGLSNPIELQLFTAGELD